jgi:hypothetical protein
MPMLRVERVGSKIELHIFVILFGPKIPMAVLVSVL